MIPKVDADLVSMSNDTFEKMLITSEKLIETGAYNKVSFRLSGGEPLLVYENYKDSVSKYYEKHKNNFTFGILSNLKVLTDDMVEWIIKNKIGIQVSLDDLYISKPFMNGQSSASGLVR